ncbi:MAG: Lrp/AsnC family transcriptional regulator [Rhodospirillaceae bacterium]|nr:Lrp/AsnC family transcriptional regulator [Rhodospirillaceae bacterium]
MSDNAPQVAGGTIDAIDLKILAALQENSGRSNVDLAAAVGLSPSPCLRRVRALEERGLIRGYKATIDRRAVGLGVRAFVEVRLEGQTEGITEKFLSRITRMPEVMSCYLMTGALDFLLDVVATDLDAYAEFTTKGLIGLPGVKEIRSSFVLKEIDGSGHLPLKHLSR